MRIQASSCGGAANSRPMSGSESVSALEENGVMKDAAMMAARIFFSSDMAVPS